MAEDNVLEHLYQVILARRGADPTQSNTAKLFAKGKKKIAQKLGEEAVETLIEGVKGDKDGVITESADLLYHLLVLWAAVDVKPDEVWAALRAREGISGIAEKASRPRD
jgi:phosphoribosyl-ATP pyrophosphohydrolase